MPETNTAARAATEKHDQTKYTYTINTSRRLAMVGFAVSSEALPPSRWILLFRSQSKILVNSRMIGVKTRATISN